MKKRVVILTGTRAEYGKLSPVIEALRKHFAIGLFVTGMHLLEQYGQTAREILKDSTGVYLYNNQAYGPATTMANTINGLNDYVLEFSPDLIIIHGDRAEALAGAVVGASLGILTVHIEGGEISGNLDDSIRHAVSKLAHVHLVSNDEAKKRLLQMGEEPERIYVTGSPEIDVMLSDLPSLAETRKHYGITFDNYGLLIYHPAGENPFPVFDAVSQSGFNFVAIYPNNDPGHDLILSLVKKLTKRENFRALPSMRFKYFLTLLQNALFIIGNSSAGIREAPVYGVPTVNVGCRQHRRFRHESIFNVEPDAESILILMDHIAGRRYNPCLHFGDGKFTRRFLKIIGQGMFWELNTQKQWRPHKCQ